MLKMKRRWIYVGFRYFVGMAQKYKMKMNEKHCIYPRRTHSSYANVFE